MNTLQEKKDALIDYLSDKTLSFGCEYSMSWEGCGIISESNSDSYESGKRILIWNTEEEEMHDLIDSIDISKADIEDARKDGWSNDHECFFHILGHPVVIGDVLNKYREVLRKTSPDLHDFGISSVPIIELWGALGATKSLNEIFNCEMEELCMNCTIGSDCECGQYENEETEPKLEKKFKDKETQGLFDFLYALFKNEL